MNERTVSLNSDEIVFLYNNQEIGGIEGPWGLEVLALAQEWCCRDMTPEQLKTRLNKIRGME